MKEEVLITIKMDDCETTIKGSKDQTILDAALENDVEAPYSCQGGACATCIGKLTSGSAAMQQNHILTDAEIDDGLILTCQALPLSNSICVDYDDV